MVNAVNYWGSKEHSHQRHYSRKLDSKNQFFLMLVKLKLNLKVPDLAFRFGISTSSVSRYLTTWICFLYHHLKELDWSPSIEQVIGTLLHSFRKNFPSTYAIIDGSEIFIQTPSDLSHQLGASINTILQNSWLPVPQMVLSATSPQCLSDQFQTLN